jgi:glutamate racemase
MTPTSSDPIGVFDSGIGGLTVVRELMRQLPNESIIYFGDTARVPYGPKSPDTVVRYSREIVDFLKQEGVKSIVVACNTATAHALPTLRAENDLPIVGVIGTQGTVNSRAYEKAIAAAAPDARITARACPLFVPLVEEGWLDTEVTRLVAHEYLDSLHDADVDTLVLGCTHYPLLKAVIGDVIGRKVRLIDSAEETAAETAATLKQTGLAHEKTDNARYRFIASDAPEQFLRVGGRFLGSSIDRVETVTLG